LAGETDRLRQRIAQFFDRIETQLKQILREAEIRESKRTTVNPTVAANFLLSVAEGRIAQYVRSEFKRRPTEHWHDQWSIIIMNLFIEVPTLD
jgi:TetR/AcrR family transcriptional regulator